MVEKILIICKNILYISWSKSLASLVTVHRFKNQYLRKPGEQRSKLSSHRLLEFHERLKQRLSKTGNFHPSLEISSFPRNEILWSLAPRTWVPRRITANLQHPLPSLSPSLSVSRMPIELLLLLLFLHHLRPLRGASCYEPSVVIRLHLATPVF